MGWQTRLRARIYLGLGLNFMAVPQASDSTFSAEAYDR